MDLDAVIELCSPDCRFATVDGRYGEGRDHVRQLLADFLSILRSTAHAVTAEWHVDDAWFAEVLADYELKDWLRIEALPRAFVVRTGPDGIRDRARLRSEGAPAHGSPDRRRAISHRRPSGAAAVASAYPPEAMAARTPANSAGHERKGEWSLSISTIDPACAPMARCRSGLMI